MITLLNAANVLLNSFLFFATLYVVASQVAKYATLGRYAWFSNLEDALIQRFPKRESLINKVFSFKLFYCETCMSFWASMISLSFVSLWVPELNFIDVLQTSFIVYLYKMVRSANDDTSKQ